MNASSFGSDIFDGDEPVVEAASPIQEAKDIHNVQAVSLRSKASRPPDSSELSEVSFGARQQPAPVVTAKPEPAPAPAPAPALAPAPEPEPEPQPQPRREPQQSTDLDAEPGQEIETPAEVAVEIPSAASVEEQRPESVSRRGRRGRGDRRGHGERGRPSERHERREGSERREPNDRGDRSRRQGRGAFGRDESTSVSSTSEARTTRAAPVGQRIAILLDLHELTSQARELEGELAVSRLLRRVGQNRATIRAVAYITPAERRLAGGLRDSGLEVVEVEAGAATAVQIAVDAMAIAGRVDCVVLAPAQVELAPLATVLRSQGLRVETASFGEDTGTGVVAQQHLTLGEDSLFKP